MNRYTIYCTEEQTKKAYELGAPIKKTYPYTNVNAIWAEGYIELNHGYVDSSDRATFTLLKAPTTEQMINWMEEQKIYFSINCIGDYMYEAWIKDNNNNGNVITDSCAPSRKEATLAAIDAALDYLSNKE